MKVAEGKVPISNGLWLVAYKANGLLPGLPTSLAKQPPYARSNYQPITPKIHRRPTPSHRRLAIVTPMPGTMT